MREKVFPLLNSLCKERGVYFKPVDLSWSPRDKRVDDGHLLTTLLHQIEHCSPFFIGLVGERYGARRCQNSPLLTEKSEPLDWLDRNLQVAAASGYPWVLDASVQRKSLFEIQSVYAGLPDCPRRHLLYKNSDTQCTFYFRQPEHKDDLFKHLSPAQRRRKLRLYEPEDSLSKQQVRAMKSDVITAGHTVTYFCTPEQLAEIVLEDWKKIIDEFCPPLFHSLNVTSNGKIRIFS